MASSLLQNYPLDKEQEKKLILREYRSLLRLLKPKMNKGDRSTVRRAFEMAADAHSQMRRKSGEPYILHPIAVAKIAVGEVGLGVTSACCALLHDVVEDTEITLEDITEEFGSVIARIVDGLTKISNVVDIKAVASMQAENFRKIILTLAEDPRVILVKLSDRLHNMRTLDSMRHDKQLKIASETSYIYAPLAHRLGLYEIKTEMEDLSMKYLHPDAFEDINKRLLETKKERTKYINEFIKPLKERLQEQDFDFKIFGRSKSIHSIWHKMRTKRVAFDEVFDLFAIRIILDVEGPIEKELCWKVYSMVTNIYRPNPDRLRDWLSVPKGNGYEALHTTVMGPKGRWVEVQIRTTRMNELAERGLAAHWKYKEGESGTTDSKLDSWLEHMAEVLENPDTDTVDFVNDFKMDLFYDEIYIYTPKGDMRVLPKGATALDFAFDVHSELGAQCIGAKVNYKLEALSYRLKSGDQVEIITSSKQRPNQEWLNFVITGKAKAKIKSFLKEERKKKAAVGKSELEQKLSQMKVPLSPENLKVLLGHFACDQALAFYYGIFTGKYDLKDLNKFEVKGNRLFSPVSDLPSVDLDDANDEDFVLPIAKGSELTIFGGDNDQIEYSLAKCCQPIPGDDVIGYVTGNGAGMIKIHRADCPNIPKIMANYAHRVIKTKWAKNHEISFMTGIKITGLDDVGIMQGITNIITGQMKINMRSLKIDSKDGIFEGTIMFFVHNLTELDKLISLLEHLDGVHKVERINQEDVV